MSTIKVPDDGPRFAVIADGEIIAQRESSALAFAALEEEFERGEFMELKIVNVRLMQETLGFIDQQLALEIAGYSITNVAA